VRSSRFLAACLVILAVGTALRILWLRADPPTTDVVGIVWHDEGAWVHNARNRALWGVWRTDEWNPVFIAPVFTALEYGAFRLLGVGTSQARSVPAISGLAAVIFLMIGLHALAGPRAALTGGALLATNYAFVMWNRAALMESTMTAAIMAGWAVYALAERRASWAGLAGAAAVLAWFTKTAAAFFVAALVLDAISSLGSPSRRRAGVLVLGGVAATAVLIGGLFVLPHWDDYAFYNWEMTVTRKPEYTIGAFLDRATWLPIVHGLFSQMWPIVVLGAAGLLSIVNRWRIARPAERLLVLWILLGLAELVVHDSGNARRYVMFIPALIALAALLIAPGRPAVAPPSTVNWRSVLGAVVLTLPLGYLVMGSLLRPLFLDAVEAGQLSPVVRLSAALAAVASVAIVFRLVPLRARLARLAPPPPIAAGLVAVMACWHLLAFVGWARGRTEMHYAASRALGTLLPAGTEVQGKLANGLALDNRIRPLFVGNGFGNYRDRLQRDDVAYILTYDLPRIGYESSDGSGLIQQMLDQYPDRQVVETFPVDETREVDRAALFRKFRTAVPDARD
jgi:4-amino-4-deoxy-L-arabinose transferase-like glycosyltransferase